MEIVKRKTSATWEKNIAPVLNRGISAHIYPDMN
jgi:hypothetical protein